MDLIGAHPATFIATDHVAGEIADTYPEHQGRFAAALNAAQITEQRIDDPAELEIFLRLATKGQLGVGERAAIAVVLNRCCALAIDDSRAIRRALHEAALEQNALLILRTQDIVVELIRKGVVSVEAADAIQVDWATNHRFKLKIASFQDFPLVAAAYRRYSFDYFATRTTPDGVGSTSGSGVFDMPWDRRAQLRPMIRPST